MKSSAVLIGMLIPGFIACAQTPKSKAAAAVLTKSNPTVTWNVGSAKTADVDCDGKPDTVILGFEKDKVFVGIVWGSATRQPQILVFPINSAAQEGFCSNPTTIRVSPLDCQSDHGPLPGCEVNPSCRDFSISDNECDPFHFYWDSSRGTLAWWRQ